MTLLQLYPAIALATVVNVFLFVGAWRGHKIELQTGEPPWWMYVGGLAYLGTLGTFFYLNRQAPLATYFDFFMAALLGEAMGVLGVFGILNFFFLSRDKAKSERVVAFFQMIILVGLFGAGFFV
jgi:hypothetical protein